MPLTKCKPREEVSGKKKIIKKITRFEAERFISENFFGNKNRFSKSWHGICYNHGAVIKNCMLFEKNLFRGECVLFQPTGKLSGWNPVCNSLSAPPNSVGKLSVVRLLPAL